MKKFIKTREFRGIMMLIYFFLVIIGGNKIEPSIEKLPSYEGNIVGIAYLLIISGIIGLISKELIFLMPAGGIYKENNDKRANLIKTINIVLIILGFLSLIAFLIIHYLF